MKLILPLGALLAGIGGASLTYDGKAAAATTGRCLNAVQTVITNLTNYTIEYVKNDTKGVVLLSPIPAGLAAKAERKLEPQPPCQTAHGDSARPEFCDVISTPKTAAASMWVSEYDFNGPYGRDPRARIEFEIRDPINRQESLIYLDYSQGTEIEWDPDGVGIALGVLQFGTAFYSGVVPSAMTAAGGLLAKVGQGIRLNASSYLNLHGEYRVAGAVRAGQGDNRTDFDTSAINVLKLGDIAAIAIGLPTGCPEAGWIVTVMRYDEFKNSDIPYKH
jgi:hypothetical protein